MTDTTSAAQQAEMQANDKCSCTFAQRMQGDGCRYCNPQEYIDRLLETIEDMNAEVKADEGRVSKDDWTRRAQPTPPAVVPGELEPAEDLYWRLHSISKCFEGSDVCYDDDGEHYKTVLDAMAAVRAKPAPPAVVEPLTAEQADRAARKMADIMDYPWEYMLEQGRNQMREHARAIVAAARAQAKEGGAA